MAAALSAALSVGPATAQDATLTARDGGLALVGDLLGFDGEVYRLRTRYGDLTVDASAVICDGPACPELAAPRAAIRITGAAEPARALLPPLFAGFAAARGLRFSAEVQTQGFQIVLTDPATKQVLADIAFSPASPGPAAAALIEGSAEFAVAALPVQGLPARVLAMEALVAVVATDNPLPHARTSDLAAALLGEAGNWQAMGGPDMPIVLHGLAPEVALSGAIAARLGRPVPAAVIHPDATALALAVARDPWALALTGLSGASPARRLPLTDSCDYPLPVSPLAVKAEDYPLAAPLYLLTARRRLPLMAREFMEYLATDAAQAVVEGAGYIDRRPTRAPLTGDGARLLGAIRNAGPEVSLAELQRLADAMTGGERLSLTFRFEDGSSQLDAHSRENLADLARLIGARAFDGFRLDFAGFSDGSGAAEANLSLSLDRAAAVRAALATLAPDLPERELPGIMAFGEALPMACDTTGAGRRINRRVELWLHPVPDWDGPRPQGALATGGEAVP